MRTAHVRVGCQNLEKQQQQQQQQITIHQFFQNVSNTIVGLVCKLGLLYAVRLLYIYYCVCVFFCSIFPRLDHSIFIVVLHDTRY